MITHAINLTDSIVYAGFWRRLAAVCIDALILLPIIGLLAYLGLSATGSATGSTSGSEIALQALNSDPLALFHPAALAALDLAVFALVVYCWVRFHGTPGKLLLGCQIIDANSGQPLSITRAILRYLAYLISALPLMLGFLWISIDRRKQGWHDKIARSVVIIEDESTKSLQQLQQEMR